MRIEEETLINKLIDKYRLAGQQADDVNLHTLDRDMSGAPQEAIIPSEEEF